MKVMKAQCMEPRQRDPLTVRQPLFHGCHVHSITRLPLEAENGPTELSMAPAPKAPGRSKLEAMEDKNIGNA